MMIVSNGMGAKRSPVVIGTRGSRLALWQAEWVRARLNELAPGLDVSLRRIKTSGDKILDVPLAKIGGKGLFIKEIEEALLAEEVDLAVHSMKDVPAVLPEQLEIRCVPRRDDPRDALVSRTGRVLADLPLQARIGTSSLRRQAQLRHHRPDLRIEMLRGNLDTRLRKLKSGEYDAVVLAAAGLKRMGWDSDITEYFSPETFVPAIGQGALAVECRRDDAFMKALLAQLEDASTRVAVTAERAFLSRLDAGCQAPVAAFAQLVNGRLSMDALIASTDGVRIVRDAIQGSIEEAALLGVALAERLLHNGGAAILAEIYGST
jgi:hydroxymethylbilane synthase